MKTPFTYQDAERQERNQAGHDRQGEVFEAFSRPEGSEGGVEYKFDRLRDKTENWFIEVLNNSGSPSGLATTKAKFWFSQSYAHSIFVPPSVLRAFIAEAKLGLMPGEEGSQGHLVDAAMFEIWNHERMKN